MGTIQMVMTEEKLESSISQPFHFWGVKFYYHAITDGLGASSDRGIFALNFDETETTRRKWRFHFSDSAKVRNIKSVIQSCPEYVSSLFSLDFNVIYNYSNQFIIPLLESCQLFNVSGLD